MAEAKTVGGGLGEMSRLVWASLLRLNSIGASSPLLTLLFNRVYAFLFCVLAVVHDMVFPVQTNDRQT